VLWVGGWVGGMKLKGVWNGVRRPFAIGLKIHMACTHARIRICYQRCRKQRRGQLQQQHDEEEEEEEDEDEDDDDDDDVEAPRARARSTEAGAGEEYDPSWRARRLRSVVLRRSAALLDRDLRERRGGGCGVRDRRRSGGGGTSGGISSEEAAATHDRRRPRRQRSDASSSKADEDAAVDRARRPPRPPLPSFAHPLVGRFEDPRVEAAFAVYKANTLSENRVTLCLTLALLALSIVSIAVSDLFLERGHGRGRSGSGTGGGASGSSGSKRGHSAFSDIGAFAVIVVVYGVRAQRLIWPRACTPEDVGAALVGKERRPWYLRWWRAFNAQHYVALLLLLPVPVEALLRQPLLMALNLTTSCVFLLAASALLLAHALAYCALAW
jgi:hypothetical protein